MLRGFLDLAVLRHDGFASGLGMLLARKLAEYSMPAERLGEIAHAAMANDPGIIAAAIADLVAIRTRDPAAENYLRPFLYYKGFHALQWHRIGTRADGEEAPIPAVRMTTGSARVDPKPTLTAAGHGSLTAQEGYTYRPAVRGRARAREALRSIGQENHGRCRRSGFRQSLPLA
jgi:hypothetical protein